MEYLISLGLTKEDARQVCDFVHRNGCAFEAWGVNKKVTARINGLHMAIVSPLYGAGLAGARVASWADCYSTLHMHWH